MNSIYFYLFVALFLVLVIWAISLYVRYRAEKKRWESWLDVREKSSTRKAVGPKTKYSLPPRREARQEARKNTLLAVEEDDPLPHPIDSEVFEIPLGLEDGYRYETPSETPERFSGGGGAFGGGGAGYGSSDSGSSDSGSSDSGSSDEY